MLARFSLILALHPVFLYHLLEYWKQVGIS